MAPDPVALARRALRPAVSPVVERLVDTVLCAELGHEQLPADLRFVDETRDMLIYKLEHMPEFFGLGMFGVTLAFDAYGAAKGWGVPFRKQPLAERRARLEEWKASPVGLFRSFTQFYEKMGSFVYHSYVEEAELPHGNEVH